MYDDSDEESEFWSREPDSRMDRFRDRIRYIHFKDCRPELADSYYRLRRSRQGIA